MVPQVSLLKIMWPYFLNGVLIFGGQKYHSVAQAEWGAHLQRQSTGNLKRWVHDTAVPVLFTRGTTAPFIHPVWSGALASGGGHAFGCMERGPPPIPTVLVTVRVGGGGAWESE